MDDAEDAQAVFRLFIPDGVAAGDDAASFAHLFGAAAKDLGLHRERQIFREGGDVEREDHFATHGIDIGHGVRGGDSAIGVGVIDDGREEIEGGNHRGGGIDAVDGRIIGHAEADQHIFVSSRIEQASERRQHLRQGLGPYLGCSAATGGEFGHAEEFFSRHRKSVAVSARVRNRRPPEH